jgi:3-oxoacyl-[acyl-carrier-protein] synthase II
MGLVTPLGTGREPSWSALLEGNSGVEGAAAPVSLSSRSNEPRAVHFARLAAEEALSDAGVRGPLGERGGVLVSCSKPLLDGGDVLSPDAVPHAVARAFGAEGPVMNLSSACATGVQSVMAAAGWIRDGRCDAALAGAAESSLHPLYAAGFDRMGVLSKARKVRPFDKSRDGFVMGEGAGVFHLESLASARARGAQVYGELTGWDFGSDAHHAARFNSNGRRMADTLSRALRRAGLAPRDLDYVNAHGTATPLNDFLETQALLSLCGDGPSPLVSSTKGATGHLLGATGAVELAFCLLSLRDGRVPPTLNLADPETDRLDFVPGRSRAAEVRRAASVSYGFGGSLAAAVVEKA